MRISRYINISAAILAAGLFIGCSKSPSAAAVQEAQLRHDLSIPANVPIKDLGVVEFSAHTPKHISIGAGSDCKLTPTVLGDGKLQIDFSVETKTNGVTDEVHSRLVAQSGQQSVLYVGQIVVSITPKLRAE